MNLVAKTEKITDLPDKNTANIVLKPEVPMSIVHTSPDAAKKYFEAAQALKKEIFETKTDVKISGTAYYVSNDGNDENDGLSPETAWRSIEKLNSFEFKDGDGVLFRRGDRFKAALIPDMRSSIITRSGVTYSTYGEGAKPILDCTVDASGEDKWKKTEWENVWECTDKLSGVDADIGVVIFDGGRAWGIKVSVNPGKQTRMFIGKTFNGINKNDAPEEPWILPYNVKRDLEFHHNWDNETVYIYSEENPGKRFNTIEFAVRRHFFWGDAHDVLIDNLDIYGAGGHGVSTAHCARFTVQNSIFRWIGGSIQSKSLPTDGRDPVRFGNSVENWQEGKDFTIHHCYSSQVYDCCWTIQWCGISNGEGDVRFENVEFHHNYTEYANNGLEVWLGPAAGNDPELQYEINDLYLHDNYTLYAGYGWSHQRPNKDANFFYGGLPKHTRTKFNRCNICNNVNLYTTCYVTWASQVGPNQFNFHDNIYFMEDNKRFGLVPIDRVSCEGDQDWVLLSDEALEKLQSDGIEQGSVFNLVPEGSVPTDFN